MPDMNNTYGDITNVYQMATEIKMEGKAYIAISTIKEEKSGRKFYYGHVLESVPNDLPENLDLFDKLKFINNDKYPKIPHDYESRIK